MKKEYSIYVQTKEDYTDGIWIKVTKTEFARFLKEMQSKGFETETENEFHYTWYMINDRVRAAIKED